MRLELRTPAAISAIALRHLEDRIRRSRRRRRDPRPEHGHHHVGFRDPKLDARCSLGSRIERRPASRRLVPDQRRAEPSAGDSSIATSDIRRAVAKPMRTTRIRRPARDKRTIRLPATWRRASPTSMRRRGRRGELLEGGSRATDRRAAPDRDRRLGRVTPRTSTALSPAAGAVPAPTAVQRRHHAPWLRRSPSACRLSRMSRPGRVARRRLEVSGSAGKESRLRTRACPAAAQAPSEPLPLSDRFAKLMTEDAAIHWSSQAPSSAAAAAPSPDRCGSSSRRRRLRPWRG